MIKIEREKREYVKGGKGGVTEIGYKKVKEERGERRVSETKKRKSKSRLA